MQNMYQNGWTYDHYISAVFGFCLDDIIPIAAYNMLGCFHDSTIAEWGKIYQKLGRVYETHGGQCTVDSAFSNLIKSLKTNLDSNNLNDYIVNSEGASMHQSAEWGMRATQSSFPCLKEDSYTRKQENARSSSSSCYSFTM